jgi:hypothetical protein
VTAETARACALVNPALKVGNGMLGLRAHERPFRTRTFITARHRRLRH